VSQAENDIVEQISEGPESYTELAPLTSKYAKLSFSDIELLLRLHKDGRTQVEIAQILQCSQPTVSQTLSRLKQTPEVIQALMKGESAGVLTQWRRATRVAAKRGDHRPAREWIEAAHPELRPQQGSSAGGGGVTINIGMPGQPIALPTIEIAPVSPRKLLEPSETERIP
jgi:hypothetical protein